MNLFLAVTHRRDDGFHGLVSVAAPLEVGDRLEITPNPSGEFSLRVDDTQVPQDSSNLVLKAAVAFRRASGWSGGAHFKLGKVTPMGAGLGGGSSDAVGALKGLNQMAGNPLRCEQLQKLSAELGSDCPLFFQSTPVVMRGRGERITPLSTDLGVRLNDQLLLLLKPPFGINTAWAYNRMAEKGERYYLPVDRAEIRLNEWLVSSSAPADALSFNSFEPVVSTKHVALPAMTRAIAERFDRTLSLSGSGSACYVWPRDEAECDEIEELVRSAWGPESWTVRTKIRAERINF